MSNFNQGNSLVNTLINSSNTLVLGNTSTGTALTVQQLGAGSLMNVATSTGSSALFVSSAGQVGVGTASPGGTFNVLSGNAGYPDTSGSGTSNVATRIQSGSICLDFGSIGGTNPFWIQNHLNTNWATNYPLLLNPNGGNVGIGVTSPVVTFDVNGSQLTRNPTVYNIAGTGWYNIGLWVADAGGSTTSGQRLRLELIGGSGYGANDPTQYGGVTTIYATILNNIPTNTYANCGGTFKHDGSQACCTQVKFVQNGSNRAQYYVYAYINAYTQHAIKVDTTQGAYFTPSFTSTSDPGANSLTVQAASFIGIFGYGGGNVGIGTTNPGYPLHVISTGTAINLSNTTAQSATNAQIGRINFGNGGSDASIASCIQVGGVNNNADLRFYTSQDFVNQNLERMRIDRSGNVGIGTSSPATPLQVNGGQISVPSFVSSPGSPYTTGQQFYFAFNGNLTDSQSGVATTTFGTQGGFVNSAAIRFNGSYYFTFPNSLVTSVVSQTVAFWWCPLSTALQTLFSFSNGSGSGGVNMNIDVSSGKINAYIATPNQWTVAALGNGAAAPPLGTWVHVALAVSTTSATLYYNGIQVDQQTGTYTNGTFGMGTVYVGINGDYQIQARRANCLLDELRVYNVTLSPTQIATLYSSTTFTVNGVSGGSVLTNSIGVGVTTPLNSIDSAGSMALGSYAGTNQAPAGGLICPGNVGIGTVSARTSPRFWSANDVTLISGNYAGDVACQIAAVGATSPDKRLALMYDTTNNIGLVQAMIYGTGPSPLCLNAAGGNVGIGTTSPGAVLDIQGGMTTTNATYRTLNVYSYFGGSSGTGECVARMYYTDAGITESGIRVGVKTVSLPGNISYPFQAYYNGTALLSVTNGGNVGIGLTNPSYTLDISTSPTGVSWTGYMWYNNSTGNPATSGTDYFAVNANGSYRTTSGGFLKVSDIRIKKNVQPISNVFESILALKPCTFQYIDEAKLGSRVIQGFIAQEVEQVLPGVVNKTGTGYVPDVYMRATATGQTVTLPDTPRNVNLVGSKVQIFYQDSSNVEAVFEANVLSYVNNIITFDQAVPSSDVFVYGTFTEQMYSVSNESMVPTLVAAIQDLSSLMTTLSAENTALKQSLVTATANFSSLEARLEQMESALASQGPSVPS